MRKKPVEPSGNTTVIVKDVAEQKRPPCSCRMFDSDGPKTIYCCWNCGKVIGKRSAVTFRDKVDRPQCSMECYSEAINHPSYEYECRGGDY